MKMKTVLRLLLIIIAATSLFIFSCAINVRGNDVKVKETNNTRLYITGNDTQLLDEYNMRLAQMEYEKLVDQKFYSEVKSVKSPNVKSMKVMDVSELSVVEEESKYTEEDLYLLARLIQGEAGSDFITDEHQLLVGQVVLNRVKNGKFPNTIREVIYDKGQYQSTTSKHFNDKPSKRALKNAKLLLEGNTYCSEDVIFQAEFKQGSGVYKTIKTIISKTYFCYE